MATTTLPDYSTQQPIQENMEFYQAQPEPETKLSTDTPMSDATAEDSNQSSGAGPIANTTSEQNSNNMLSPQYEETKDISVNSILQVQHSDSTNSLVAEYERVIHKMDDQLKVQNKTRTTIKDFVSLKVLGTGTYGKVMLVKHKKTQKLYAMKVLKKEQIRKKNQVEHTKTERRVLEKIQHSFIVQMKYAFADREKLYFVLEYCHGGELFFYLTNLRRFKEEATRFYSSTVLLAMKALHENNIVYRDLKPENILIDAEGFALLTDFGLSKDNMSDSVRAKSLCGTAEYLAPEVLEKDRAYGKACDWWSFGCVIYEMLTGHPPFYSTDRKQMFADIRQKEVKFYDFHTPAARDLLSQLLVKDPNERLQEPSLIMQHAFFEGVDWEQLALRQVSTPYTPQLKDPTDTSHFDTQQTGIPLSPPPGSDVAKLFEKDQQEGVKDEFSDFHFSPQNSFQGLNSPNCDNNGMMQQHDFLQGNSNQYVAPQTHEEVLQF